MRNLMASHIMENVEANRALEEYHHARLSG